MSEIKKTKTGNTFATVLIGLIILAFMFTGYQQFEGGGTMGATDVGSVSGEKISVEEYNTEYNRQIEFYKQIMGGDLNAKQIEEMNIKQMAIKNIVQRKLMGRLAKDLGTFPSNNEITNEIKALPYFQTNGQFNIELYKQLLTNNRLTPANFEKDVEGQLRLQKLQALIGTYPISKGYLQDLEALRALKANAEVVEFSKNSLAQFIPVSGAEVQAFLSDETNNKRVESMFNDRKASLGKPEEVKARHILLVTQGKDEAQVKAQIEKIAKEVTPANFIAKAKQYTEDPSGKENGGDLGTFTKGNMVAEFEAAAFSQKPGTISAPVKTNFGYHLIMVEKHTPEQVAVYANFKNQLATEMMRKDRVEELKNLTVSVANELRAAMESGNAAQVKAIVNKYQLKHSNGTINRLDGFSSGTMISTENMNTIFNSDLTKTGFHSFDDGINMIMVRTTPQTEKEKTVVTAENADANLKNALARKMMDNILKDMEANTKVKLNRNMLQI